MLTQPVASQQVAQDSTSHSTTAPPVRYAWLSVGAALLTLGIKWTAYAITGSVSLLSDALESFINLTVALLTVLALKAAAKPPDEEHAYGHGKVEYFSSGAEGALIIVAGVMIIVSAIERLLSGGELTRIPTGLLLGVIASAINGGVARLLLRAARRQGSIALEAEARHLTSDVWTSIAILSGLCLVGITGWKLLDPILALLVAGYVGSVGVKLLHRSMMGLLDTSLPTATLQRIVELLDRYRMEGIGYHALRTRQSGTRSFVSMHIQVPGRWSVKHGHDLLESIERDIRAIVPRVVVFTHLEPTEDPASWKDIPLDRSDPS